MEPEAAKPKTAGTAAMAATVETAAMAVTAGNGGEERNGSKGRGG